MEVRLGSVNTNISTQTKRSFLQLKGYTALNAYQLQKHVHPGPADQHNRDKHHMHERLSCKGKQKITVIEKATDPTD